MQIWSEVGCVENQMNLDHIGLKQAMWENLEKSPKIVHWTMHTHNLNIIA